MSAIKKEIQKIIIFVYSSPIISWKFSVIDISIGTKKTVNIIQKKFIKSQKYKKLEPGIITGMIFQNDFYSSVWPLKERMFPIFLIVSTAFFFKFYFFIFLSTGCLSTYDLSPIV